MKLQKLKDLKVAGLIRLGYSISDITEDSFIATLNDISYKYTYTLDRVAVVVVASVKSAKEPVEVPMVIKVENKEQPTKNKGKRNVR
jgi:hypothetical protein